MRTRIESRVWTVFALAGLLGWGLVWAARGPQIRFDETTLDFGEIRSTQKVERDWIFHNDGDEPLEILRTRSSCGCTMSMADEEPVAPGATGRIRVEFDPTGLEGAVKRTLMVDSNDTEAGLIRLTVTAKVSRAEVETRPGDHPPIHGQSLLMGECASCHAAPAGGKTGAQLYASVCAMCHGEQALGRLAPSLRHPSYLDARSDEELAEGIAYGTASSSMPGFSDLMGGPLSRAQIDSLVRLLRDWGSSTRSPDGKTTPDDG